MQETATREKIEVTKTGLCIVLVILFLIMVQFAACSTLPEPTTPPTPSHEIAPPASAPTVPSKPTTTHPGETEHREPILLKDLKRNCQINQGSEDFDTVGLSIGETAVNFALKDIHGTEVQLSRLLAEKPVVMVFGSFT